MFRIVLLQIVLAIVIFVVYTAVTFYKNLLSRKFSDRSPESFKNNILNVGIALAMEFGENWGKDIQDRLKALFPHLTQGELDDHNKVCRQAMRQGQDSLQARLDQLLKNNEKISETDLKQVWMESLLKACPWIDEENLTHLFAQSMYYASKEGLTRGIVI